MTRARNVVHQLLEDGPEDTKGFIDQYAKEMRPEHFSQYPFNDFADFMRRLEKAGVLQMLRKKYDDDVIGYAITLLVAERSPLANVRRCFAELKKLARFQV